jgi:hypothetical protein
MLCFTAVPMPASPSRPGVPARRHEGMECGDPGAARIVSLVGSCSAGRCFDVPAARPVAAAAQPRRRRRDTPPDLVVNCHPHGKVWPRPTQLVRRGSEVSGRLFVSPFLPTYSHVRFRTFPSPHVCDGQPHGQMCQFLVLRCLAANTLIFCFLFASRA